MTKWKRKISTIFAGLLVLGAISGETVPATAAELREEGFENNRVVNINKVDGYCTQYSNKDGGAEKTVFSLGNLCICGTSFIKQKRQKTKNVENFSLILQRNGFRLYKSRVS